MLRIHAQKFGDVTILRLHGQVVTGEVPCLSSTAISQSDARTIVLDLMRVNRIDARGLGLLLELRAHMQSKGGELILLNVHQLVQQVLEITRLDSVFRITTEREVAALMSNGTFPLEVWRYEKSRARPADPVDKAGT